MVYPSPLSIHINNKKIPATAAKLAPLTFTAFSPLLPSVAVPTIGFVVDAGALEVGEAAVLLGIEVDISVEIEG